MKLTFDMKGSTFNRTTKLNEDSFFWKHRLDHPKVLKDCNFLKISKEIGRNLMILD